jgi:hypothetical protein
MMHTKDGLYFERVGQGDVRIVLEKDQYNKTEITLPADMWASVVATVSLRGEDATTWREALAQHNKAKGG